MDEERRGAAETRFTDALRKTGARDPRGAYRIMMRELKARDQAKYERTVREFQASVIEAIAEREADPLETWLEFGRKLANEIAPGQDLVIDGTGRARSFEPPPSWSDLILHLPDEQRLRAVVVGSPPEPSPAQLACVRLLVEGNVRLPEGPA